MQFLTNLALITLAAAAPLQSGRYIPGTPEGHRPHSYVPGSLVGGGLSKRAVGPGAAAVIGGVVSGVVAPAVTRWANRALGPAKRQEEEASLTWDEARASFAAGVTASVLEDGAEEGEAAVCVSVPYQVEDPSKTRDAVSVSFTADGQEAVYDCFLLTEGAVFTIDAADYSEANVGIAGGEIVDGVLAA